MTIVNMKMLRWMCGKTRNDKISNTNIRDMVGVAPIKDKLKENRLNGSAIYVVILLMR